MTMTQPVNAPATSTANTVGQDAYNYVETNYPQFAWMLLVPELASVINAIANNGITDANQIQGMLQNTTWWRTQSADVRNWYQLEIQDPATAQEQIQAASQNIQTTADELGVRLTQAQLTSLAFAQQMNGWSDVETKNHIAKGITANPDGSFAYSPYYIDPATGKEEDTATGREGYYGPNNEPATPTKPADMTGWASFQQRDGTTVYYRPGTSPYFTTNAQGQEQDAFTGRRAYYGPQFQPATPTPQSGPGWASWIQHDGTQVWYRTDGGTGTSPTGPGTGVTSEPGGALQYSAQALQALAKQYLVNVSPQTLAQWSAQIASGQQTQQGFQSYLQQMATGQYPWLSQAIADGQTPQQALSPYTQMIQSELGIDASNIDLTQPKWAKLLTTTDPKTGGLAQLPLYQATQMLRSDPSFGWSATPNGVNAQYDLLQSLQQTLGLRNYSGASVNMPGAFGSTGG